MQQPVTILMCIKGKYPPIDFIKGHPPSYNMERVPGRRATRQMEPKKTSAHSVSSVPRDLKKR